MEPNSIPARAGVGGCAGCDRFGFITRRGLCLRCDPGDDGAAAVEPKPKPVLRAGTRARVELWDRVGLPAAVSSSIVTVSIVREHFAGVFASSYAGGAIEFPFVHRQYLRPLKGEEA